MRFMKTESTEIFNKFLMEIAGKVSQNAYAIWFSQLEPLKIENNVFTIKVPMEVHKQMLSETYKDTIDAIFFSITGINYTFKYVTEEEVENFTPPPIENTKEETFKEEVWDTHLKKEYTFDNYVVGNSNRLAFIAAKAVAEAPGTIHNPLFIYGRSGLGKTHLMHAIGNYITLNSDKKVLYTTSNEYRNDFTGIATLNNGVSKMNYANEFKNKYRNVDVLIIDDIQFLTDAEKTQQEFFHTFNELHQANKQIIISSDRSPDDLKKIEERLRSRFMWGLPVDIYPPDFNLRCDIIRAKIKNTSIENKLDDEVVEYIANSCVNDVRHIEGTIRRLLAYTAMMVPEKITLDFAIEALKDYVNTNIFINNSIASIQNAVAEYFKISIDDLKGKRRTNNVVKPRHIAMYLCREETDEPLIKIGLEFGGRDHSTVSTAIDKIKEELETNDNLNKMLKEIKNKLQ